MVRRVRWVVGQTIFPSWSVFLDIAPSAVQAASASSQYGSAKSRFYINFPAPPSEKTINVAASQYEKQRKQYGAGVKSAERYVASPNLGDSKYAHQRDSGNTHGAVPSVLPYESARKQSDHVARSACCHRIRPELQRFWSVR